MPTLNHDSRAYLIQAALDVLASPSAESADIQAAKRLLNTMRAQTAATPQATGIFSRSQRPSLEKKP